MDVIRYADKQLRRMIRAQVYQYIYNREDFLMIKPNSRQQKLVRGVKARLILINQINDYVRAGILSRQEGAIFLNMMDMASVNASASEQTVYYL